MEIDTIKLGAPCSLASIERAHVEAVLKAEPRLGVAAIILGINACTLYRKRRAWALADKKSLKVTA